MDKKKENGAAILEMALIAPFFIILLVSVFDITRCISAHSQLVTIIQEGLRLSGGMRFLETLPWSVTIVDYTNPALDVYKMNNVVVVVTTPPQGPVVILSRLAQIARVKLDELNIKKNNWVLSMEVDYTPDPHKIKIRVDAKYDGFFNLFDGMDIQAQVFGPYDT